MPPWDNNDDTSQSDLDGFIDSDSFTVATNRTEPIDINDLYVNEFSGGDGGGSSPIARAANRVFGDDGLSIERGLPVAAMEVIGRNNMTTWYYEKLSELTDASFAAEALAGEVNDHSGAAGVQTELIEHAAQNIGALAAEEVPLNEAFNTVTNSWPRELKALVAANEFLEERDDEQYHEEIEHFARAAGTLDGDDNIVYSDDDLNVSELTYPVNPFESNELDEQEAETIIKVRLAGLDESSLDFDAIEDHDDFHYWLEEVEDVQDAVDYHPFGTNGNLSLVQQFAPPREWENMDPNDIITMGCARCGTVAAYGEGDDGPTVATEYNTGGVLLNQGEEFFHTDETRQILCSDCHDEMVHMNTPDARCFVVSEDGDTAFAEFYGNIGHDRAGPDDVPFFELSWSMRQQAYAAGGSIPPLRDWYEVSPRPGVDGTALFESIADGHVEVQRAPLIITNIRNGRRVRAWFPSDRPDCAKEAKNLMEGTGPEVSA